MLFCAVFFNFTFLMSIRGRVKLYNPGSRKIFWYFNGSFYLYFDCSEFIINMKAHFKKLLCFCRTLSCLFSNPSGLHPSWTGVLQLLLMLVFGNHICLAFSCQSLKNMGCSDSLAEMSCYYSNRISMAAIFFHLCTLYTLNRSESTPWSFWWWFMSCLFVFKTWFTRERILAIVIHLVFSWNS